MAHAVEGRYPFLDVRIIDFCNQLPPNLKLRGLKEKYLLKRLGQELLPAGISARRKQPYRAPIHRSFFHDHTPDYVRDMLSPKRIAEAGLFKPAAVNQLVNRVDGGAALGETDDMALAGILSTQLLYFRFVADFRLQDPLSERDDVKVCLEPMHAATI
jgi:asparagine synthase (glutamine-hydrolysing)